MQMYEAPTAHVIDFDVVNVIAISVADTPETLVVWGGLVRDVSEMEYQGNTPI